MKTIQEISEKKEMEKVRFEEGKIGKTKGKQKKTGERE